MKTGYSIEVLGQHLTNFHHGALHVVVTNEKETTMVRIIVTHLSPMDGHKRADEARELIKIANGDYLTDVDTFSGPYHVWIHGWKKKIHKKIQKQIHTHVQSSQMKDKIKHQKEEEKEDDADTEARLHFPQGGRTTIGSLLSIGGKHRNVGMEDICISYMQHYWGRGDDDAWLSSTIGDWIYGTLIQIEKEKEKTKQKMKEKKQKKYTPLDSTLDDYPVIHMYFTNQECIYSQAHLQHATPSIVPRKGYLTHSNVPVVIVGDGKTT